MVTRRQHAKQQVVIYMRIWVFILQTVNSFLSHRASLVVLEAAMYSASVELHTKVARLLLQETVPP
jgi:hypothetical protein